jgi:CubicO group peptidase (beta-lactamase class C family)
MSRLHGLGLVLAASLVTPGCGDDAGADEASGRTQTDTGATAVESESESGSETQTESESETETDTETGDGDGDGPIYPDTEWPTGDPEDHGLSSAALVELAGTAEGLDTNCMVVIHEGVLVGEWYWNGYDAQTDQINVFSVTKSFTSALVGIAQAQGLLGIDDSAADYIDQWAGTDADTVTIRDLISNDSGRFWDFSTDYLQMTFAEDQTQFSIDLSQAHPPNTWWEYNNSAIQTLERVLELATGEDLEDFAQASLLEPIGASISLGRDGAGNPQTYQGVSASCQDLARFGYLYLRGGEWAGGQQVLSPEWIAESTSPSTPLNSAYGYMWWLNVEGHWVLPSAPTREEGDGQIFGGGSPQIYAAVGALGQLIVVDPADGYVFVRLGDAPDLADLTGFDKLMALWAGFEAAKL